MNELVIRKEYIEFLQRHQDKPVIKVVSGVRRSGKSTLFKLFQDELISSGVEPSQIITMNFEDLTYQHLLEFMDLFQYLTSRLHPTKKTYIFLDEIQMIDNFEKVVDSLILNDKVDLYITGSNAYFLSSELATLLSGRYVQLNMLPLSFKEFVTWHRANGTQQSLAELYELYIKTSFPYALRIDNAMERFEYLQGLYSTVVLNDIIKRMNIQDVSILERIIAVLLSSIGSLITINTIKNTLISKGYKIAHQTIDRYVNGILDSLIMYEVKRYNIKGKALLENQSKYYTVDTGLRQLVLRDHLEDYGHILENIIYLELKRRGYEVYVGENNQFEVDFVAIDADNNISYYQVALTTLDEGTLKRELRALESIDDQYPKYLLTLDQFNKTANYNGIMKLNVIDWLLE
ncbi:ATP-binding protein [Macrococcus capreoli]|uniref:ATP-binding protein n=1 Tax=Macrococcus capreoli TaxID=2982690 RepID=UPI0021D589AD|nr:ATP-binding protein [Macrococcus sp. TMW 2.2395]MCU7558553.1 ATP-binding protein [Macrococcus sp. TMW 2.2395]